MSLLIVIPTLNEATQIDAVIAGLLAEAPDGTLLVVADGGSTDGTPEIVRRRIAAEPRLRLIHNPQRLQSAGINLAVDLLGEGRTHLLRADAHAAYPPRFAGQLLEEMARTGAASVTVAMETVGSDAFTQGVAAAQNSILGTGGSAHRIGLSGTSGGRFVDHGHHALMRLADFRAVGGYDPGQSHNEDAELDHRLRRAGRKIWLTDRLRIRYLPRRSLGALYRQYLAHGRGRATTVMKHALPLKPRQMAPALVPVAVGLAGMGVVLAPVDAAWLLLAGPALLWAVVCLGFGSLLALRSRQWAVLWSGPAAMAMHLGWGVGFLRRRFSPRATRTGRAARRSTPS